MPKSEIKNRPKNQSNVLNLIIGIGLATVAGIGLSITIANPEEHPFIFALSLAWLVDLFVLATTSKAFLAMTPGRFRVADWERSGKLYERLGVGVFRWMLLYTPLGWVNPKYGQLQSRTDLDRLLKQLNRAEGVHLVAGGVTLVAAAVFALDGQTAIGMWLVLISIPLYVYPIMVQRWNRVRVLRVLQRLAARSINIP